MKIQNLFARDIFRPINGVVKADQLDESSVWQELEEFVVTKELDQHLRRFFSAYGESLKSQRDPEVAGMIGVWVSGFFGSGKSHFIKVLSYLLRNSTHTYNGSSREAVEFFESKIKDAMLFGDIKRAVAAHTDVILFNIDSKAEHRAGRDAILAVFLKVLNEMQGYSGDYPHIAHLERYLESKGKYPQFQTTFLNATGSEWAQERDAYHFHRDEVVEALSETLKLSGASAEKWVDDAESSFVLTVENFCKWVKEYLDSKGPDHRLIFLVDEVGQFIGNDTHLMLSLQTITEELGTVCQGRAWVVVTSQEDIDAVLGEMKKSKANDFSKIQGRFKTRLSLSSANVDEVIQDRLLDKRADVGDELETLFKEKGDILKNQLTFVNCGMTLKSYKDAGDFTKNYPFAPYQFQLVQKIFEAIRRAGATGVHLARGERSLLDAFQTAAKEVALEEVGVLIPLYRFYPSIENFLDTAVKLTIDQARSNPSLEQPFDTQLLQSLFLVRYVDEIKTNVDNLVTLSLDEIDADRLALRRKVETSLQRLENETLISRSGDLYFFLTNEERDINHEIKAVEIASGAESKLMGELIFSDVLKDQRKYRYQANKMDFVFNRYCDLYPAGSQSDGALQVSVITPLNDEYDLYDNARCVLESGNEGGQVLIRLGNDDRLGRELRSHLQTDRYLKQKHDGALPESAKRILRNIAEDNQERRIRLVNLAADMLLDADYYAVGQPIKPKATASIAAVNEALEYLVNNSFAKMGYLQHLNSEPAKEIQAILRSNDIGQQTLALQMPEGNKQALDDVRDYISLSGVKNQQVILQDMIDRRYALRPYGWPEDEVLILVARMLVLSEISLMMDGALIPTDKSYDAITTQSKRRKIVIHKRQTSDPRAIQNARSLGKELFHETGPDSEDTLFTFLQNKLREWQSALSGFKPLADTGNYPGRDEIADGLAQVKKLLAYDSSYKFIEQFNSLKNELLDLTDHIHDLDNFYQTQRPTWDRLRREHEKFQLNRTELENDANTAAALARMQEILSAPAPYGMLKEADGLISKVNAVNSGLVNASRQRAIAEIDKHFSALQSDLAKTNMDAELSQTCLNPLATLRGKVETQESLAHIAQAEVAALKAFDEAVARIETFSNDAMQKTVDEAPSAVIKKHRVIEPAKLAPSGYLETPDDVRRFLDDLRQALETAIANNERIQIR